jgi:hypothetical protein
VLKLMGAPTMVLTSDRDVSYSTIENALHEQGFLEGYLIRIRPFRDQLEILIQVSVPVSWISGSGVPGLPAEQVLRSLADAVAEIDSITEE